MLVVDDKRVLWWYCVCYVYQSALAAVTNSRKYRFLCQSGRWKPEMKGWAGLVVLRSPSWCRCILLPVSSWSSLCVTVSYSPLLIGMLVRWG